MKYLSGNGFFQHQEEVTCSADELTGTGGGGEFHDTLVFKWQKQLTLGPP